MRKFTKYKVKVLYHIGRIFITYLSDKSCYPEYGNCLYKLVTKVQVTQLKNTSPKMSVSSLRSSAVKTCQPVLLIKKNALTNEVRSHVRLAREAGLKGSRPSLSGGGVAWASAEKALS